MTKEEYLQQFADDATGPGTKAKIEKALDLAHDVRKFEIDLYWKRAAYFWTFIGASYAGYGLVQRPADPSDAWLSLLFSSLGLVFSFAWYLVNRGSKFWQNNWEVHVDLLEDRVSGPLYKTIARGNGWDPLTAPAEYSVSKINQMLSLFIFFVWGILFVKSGMPISLQRNIAYDKLVIASLTAAAIACLWFRGRSQNKATRTKLGVRTITVDP